MKKFSKFSHWLAICVFAGGIGAYGDELTRPVSTLIAAGSAWRYLDNGTDQGAAWRGREFNDSGWASGVAQLGYGDGDETTVVRFGPDAGRKYVTTYFRRAFEVVSASGFSSLTARVLA